MGVFVVLAGGRAQFRIGCTKVQALSGKMPAGQKCEGEGSKDKPEIAKTKYHTHRYLTIPQSIPRANFSDERMTPDRHLTNEAERRREVH